MLWLLQVSASSPRKTKVPSWFFKKTFQKKSLHHLFSSSGAFLRLRCHQLLIILNDSSKSIKIRDTRTDLGCLCCVCTLHCALSAYSFLVISIHGIFGSRAWSQNPSLSNTWWLCIIYNHNEKEIWDENLKLDGVGVKPTHSRQLSNFSHWFKSLPEATRQWRIPKFLGNWSNAVTKISGTFCCASAGRLGRL